MLAGFLNHESAAARLRPAEVWLVSYIIPLIKSLVGALRPSGGRMSVMGIDPVKDPAALSRQIGYMPQAPALYDDLSARANVAFFAAAHESDGLDCRVDDVIAFCELTDRAGDAVHTFSGGMKQRVSLACALVHKPSVLFLDEPTAAVDIHLKRRFWSQFRELAAEGTTIVLSTHLMDEALMCDRLAVLEAGRLLAVDAPLALLDRGRARLTLDLGTEERRIEIGAGPQELAGALHSFGLEDRIRAIRVDGDDLESVILRLHGEENS